MQYFIPAWYQEGSWMENEQAWYRSRTVTEFDDTVKQVQLFFRRHVAPFEIMLLGFSPNFRHFLHRQGVYHAPWWSCFDAMQGIRTRTMQTFSFHDLAWPEGIEFVYSPFAVIALHGGEKYAQVEFAEDGNMFRVDLFQDGQIVSRNLYDDRGFVSCQISYRDGAPRLQRFFDEEGTWKLAEYLGDGHVVVNPDSAWFLHGEGEDAEEVPYRKRIYASLDEVVAEVVEDFLSGTSAADGFTVALDPQHEEVLAAALAGRHTIVSCFGRRQEKGGFGDASSKLLGAASCIVCDKKATAEAVKGLAGNTSAPIRVISPYETRIETGISLHLHVQNILVAADALDAPLFDATMVALAAYIRDRNHLARVCLFTRSSRYDVRAKLLERVQAALSRRGLDPEMAGGDAGLAENELSGEDSLAGVFSVAQCVDELHVSRTIREQRIVVDLSPVPDQFLQISAMSCGIPQITRVETEYVADGRNGRVVSDISELQDDVDFYLSSVEHVNEAQIASYDLGRQFSAQNIVAAWKEAISLGQDARA